ncbi:16S rRNA (cytidine(1402)-2'-O)-methyltransferase [Candidatus Microgenomates bacterium]|nr:16S rRNA (cytidine(1402)-2'-O)-methyltransferase [Candidatus Microgenomates bacterium]
MGKLLVVPTPIGNLSDITLRGLEILKSVNVIACEDTRHTRILLDHFQIKEKQLISYFAPREQEKIPQILANLQNEDVALVTDAGMPGISDPGFQLIKICIEHDIAVEVLPGSAAFVTALVGSGLPTDKFIFLGFVPKKGKARYFNQLKGLKDTTVIVYESPYRIIKSLEFILETFGDVACVVVRELTKIHEEYIRGSASEVLANLNNRPSIKGEIVLLFRI